MKAQTIIVEGERAAFVSLTFSLVLVALYVLGVWICPALPV
ncbi:hypothetical protein [Nitrospira sp. M1]